MPIPRFILPFSSFIILFLANAGGEYMAKAKADGFDSRPA